MSRVLPAALLAACVVGGALLASRERFEAAHDATPEHLTDAAPAESTAPSRPLAKHDALPSLQHLPLAFIPNHGQWRTETLFSARSPSGRATLRADGLRLAVPFGQRGLHVVGLIFEGGTPITRPVGEQRLRGKYHYFLGASPEGWHTDVPAFTSVMMEDVYPGISVRYRDGGGVLEYDLILEADAALDDVRIRCEGVDSLSLAADGALLLHCAAGTLRQSPPLAFSLLDGESVPCRYRLLDRDVFGFELPGTLARTPVVIDPGLSWATFLGGNDGDGVGDMALRDDGSVILVGSTESDDFPVSPGAFDETFNNTLVFPADDAFVTCLDPTGSELVFSTYLGSLDLFDGAFRVDLADDGSIVVVGETQGDGFPTTAGAFQSTYAGGTIDVFVSQLDATGSTLLFSTLLGGSKSDGPKGVSTRSDGCIAVAGKTDSPDFPTSADAFRPNLAGVSDAYLTLLDPAESGPSQLTYSTFFGGSGPGDEAEFVSFLDDGSIVLAGFSSAAQFTTTPGAWIEDWPRNGAGFVTRFHSDPGQGLIYSTFATLEPDAAAVDSVGNVYLAGIQQDPTPTFFVPTPGAYDESSNGGLDTAVLRLDATGSTVEWATYLGGSLLDLPEDIAIADDGGVLLTGQTHSADFPVTPGAHQEVLSDWCDAYVVKLSGDGTQLLYGTYLGTLGFGCAFGAAVLGDGDSHVIVTGSPDGFDFVSTPGAFDEVANGIFVVRLALEPDFVSLGFALPGTLGAPKLVGKGGLSPGEDLSLNLTRANPNSVTALIIGFAQIDAPFKGGTLVPSANLVIAGLPIDAAGALMIDDTWPIGLPGGLQIFFQHWIIDPVGPAGFAASNGLQGTTP